MITQLTFGQSAELAKQDTIRDRHTVMLVKQLKMDECENHADEAWNCYADRAVWNLAHSKEEFTVDDVWDILDTQHHVDTHEHRAMGPVMRRAALAGLAIKTDRTQTSRRPDRQAGDVRVWHSLKYNVGT